MTYTYDQVFQESVKYFNGDELAAKVFVDKYAMQNKNGEYLELSPNDMHRRLAKEFARIESKYPNPLLEDKIFDLLKDFKFIVPQGSPMSAIGNKHQLQSLSNCFVIQGVHSEKLDSYGGIMLADQELAQIMKRRGGVGLDISGIRPKNMPTNNSAKTTDGIAVFMERFSNTCREVAQNGRRGAEMQTISVNHPEIETFINIKRDLKKVTGANISIKITDEFMHAVKNNADYILRYPVDANPADAQVTKKVKAKEIWDQIVESAWASAEPGILFWDNVKKNTPSDIYKDFGHESISTNPCFSGDTLIAVADGRSAVSIKQLAEEGKDVPVYSVDPKTGAVEIKMGRNPRITGYNKKLVRVNLDDGSFFDVTPDHKCLLKNGSTVFAKDLKQGDSLPRFDKKLEPVKENGKDYYMIHGNAFNINQNRVFEHRLIAKFHDPQTWGKIYNNAKQGGFAQTGGLVVHHKDFNRLNNAPDNLEIMTFKDHVELHNKLNDRDMNGEKNSNYSGFTSAEIKEHALTLTKQLNQRFTNEQWQKYAKANKLPQTFSMFRKDELGTISHLAKICAAELGIEFINENPKVVKTLALMLSQGYDARILNGKVFVKKNCEKCNKEFEVESVSREAAFCSKVCVNLTHNQDLNQNEDIKKKRDAARDSFNYDKMIKVKNDQARIYSSLKFTLKREPLMKEWEEACKLEKVPCRIGKVLKFGFKNFKEVAEAGNLYNHKVVSVTELSGEHTVYNITVDDFHTVSIVTSIKDKEGNKTYHGVSVCNCGEIILPKYDACRLLCLNLSSYVESPFTKEAKFNFELFKEHSMISQRLMDDIIDLEIECVDNILEKINKDPEPEEAKVVEKNLWTKIRDMNVSGRRTGLGVTALGDALAMLNIKYGSKESIDMTYKIYRALAVAAHSQSCILASERGAFPIFSYNLEKDHEYLNNIFADCDENIRDMWKNVGRRNIALTTTAPTGSVSMLTQTSSGIEPVYLLSYTRRKKHNPSDKHAKVDFVDALGDSWQEFTVYHHGVKKFMDTTGLSVEDSAYFGSTSNEIDWVASVDLQAAAQKSIDHSISKTCVTGDSLIETDQGLVYLDELIDFNVPNSTIEVSNIKTKNCFGNYEDITNVHTMNTSNLLKVSLENGLEVKVSPKERFMVLNSSGLEEWRFIEELKAGDKVKLG